MRDGGSNGGGGLGFILAGSPLHGGGETPSNGASNGLSNADEETKELLRGIEDRLVESNDRLEGVERKLENMRSPGVSTRSNLREVHP